ncbi:MAG: class I SAM-dependent methyltransferase [Terrimicrobiaceae bacterium]
MSGKLPGLDARLAAEIATSGPMPFARFMELALYDPDAGYYASGKSSIGKEGDFFTNVSIGPVYGEILAGQFVEMWQALGRPADFTLIEQGAGDGRLARDVLDALSLTPIAGVPLFVIEPSPVLQAAQAETLRGLQVSWVPDAAALPVVCGVHYSNELFDAFPVHLLISTGDASTNTGSYDKNRGMGILPMLGKSRMGRMPMPRIRTVLDAWAERYVGLDESGAFAWQDRPLTGELAGVVENFPLRPAGFTTEVCLSHRPLLRALGEKISRGFLLAVDYGMSQESLLAEHRSSGTLSCYRGHRRDANPLADPGDKDLTAHVNFTQLARDAVQAGWQFEQFTDQHHFLVGAATAMLLALDGKTPDPASIKKVRSLQTLLHPESLGRHFQAILFSKGTPTTNLSGFQHARKDGLK